MNTLDDIKNSLQDYAKDLRLNIDSVLQESGAPGLSAEQIIGVALACAYSTADRGLAEALLATNRLSPEQTEAAKAAAVIMAQNNIYYRAIHLLEDKGPSKLPPRLRMNVIGKPGIPKIDFELFCLGVSVLNGCQSCINAHAEEAKKADVSSEAVQSVFRIAAVIKGVSQARQIG